MINDCKRFFALIISMRLYLKSKSMTFIVRYCDNCTTDEVCLADEERREKVPTCHRIKYAKDPTGCGGLCEMEQICYRLGHGAFR